MEDITKLVTKTLILAHGTSATNMENIINSKEMRGDISPNWDVSDEWIYFWNNFTVIRELIDCIDNISVEVVTKIDNLIEDVNNGDSTYHSIIKEFCSALDKIPEDSRAELSKMVVAELCNRAFESSFFSLDGCEKALTNIIFFDGSKLDDIEIDDSCDCESTRQAVRVPSPVKLESSNGFLGIATNNPISISPDERDNIVEAISESILEDDSMLDYSNNGEEIRSLYKKSGEAQDKDLSDESYQYLSEAMSLHDDFIQDILDDGDSELFAIYCGILKADRLAGEAVNTIEHKNKSDTLDRRKAIVDSIIRSSREQGLYIESPNFDAESANFMSTEQLGLNDKAKKPTRVRF